MYIHNTNPIYYYTTTLYYIQVVPNTLNLASNDDLAEARIIIEASAPYTMTSVNQTWCDLFGYKHQELIGKCSS